MNANDQNGGLADAQPGPPQPAADREHAGHTTASAAPALLPGGITARGTAADGAPRQGTGAGRSNATFWDLLSPAERAGLQALGRVSVFQPGHTIRAEGENTTDVLVLTEGWVKILSAARVLALRGPGDIVGELAGNSAGYRNATIAATGPVRALVVTHDRFTLFLDSNPGAGKAYRNVVTQRWQEAEDQLRSRSASNGAQRLAGLLLDLAARHGTPAASGTAITIPLSQEEIASHIGTSRATVTRALGEWRRRGLISTAWHQITIKSAPALRNAAARDTNPHCDRDHDR